jgi:hypothetical protein
MFNNDKLLFTLKWNWGYILIFVLIWSYGFENVAFPLTAVQSLLLSSALAMTVFLLVFVGEKYKIYYQENIEIGYLDSYIFLILCVIFILFSWGNLTNSLVGDQLYHAQASQSQTTEIAESIIASLKLNPALEYKLILRVINIVLLVGIVAGIYLLGKVNIKIRAVLLTVSFFAIRLLTNNSYNDPHPPFRLFPLWFNSTIWGLNDFSFRSISLFSLIVFVFILFRYGQNYFGKFHSFLLAFAVGTIPLLWHVASVVEQSIWTALSWSLILLFIQKDLRNFHYVRWISVVSIAGLMRASAFVGLIPIGLIAGLELLKSRDNKAIKTYLVYALPILVLLPFLLKTLIVGTPSTADKEIDIISKILLSFEGWFSIKMLYYHILLPWVLFLPFFWMSTIKNWLRVLVYVFFFLAAYIIFYSIKPFLWGVPRYQAEFGIPFVILGFYGVFTFLYQKFPGYIKYFGILIMLSIVYNILIYTNLNWLNAPVDTWSNYFNEVKTGRVRILSEGEGIFNTDQALREIRRAGFAKFTCKAGITYGTFSEILNGYTIGEMRRVNKNFPLCSSWGPFNVSELNELGDIKLILFIDKYNKEREIQDFVASGHWVIWKQFYNEKFGSTIVGIKRKK